MPVFVSTPRPIRVVSAFAAVLILSALLLSLLALPARVSAGSCAEDPANLLRNGTMAPGTSGAYGVIANKWKAFVVGGTVPHFENAPNEGYDPNGSQYIWRDLGTWDAGIYQKVKGLAAGQTYEFWIVWGQALHDMAGDNARATLINRQIGIDPTGGTDPNSPNVIWSVPYYGGGGFNRPEWHLVFTATQANATFYLRARNGHADGRNKVFFDTACLYPARGEPTSTPWSPTAPPPTAAPSRTPVPGARIDDTSASITYSSGWSLGSDARAYNGTYHYARGVRGAAVNATYTFTGDRVTLWYIGYKNRGKARILIDGKAVGTVDQYTPAVTFNLSRTFANLGPGAHQLKIKNKGAKRAAATDSYIVLDALEVDNGTASTLYKNLGAVLTATPTPTRRPTQPPHYIPFAFAAPAAPTPDDPSVIWDPRLPGLNVSLQPAAVSTGTLYWKLIRADYHDPFQHGGEFGGDHNMYFVATNASGTRVPNETVWQAWPDGSVSALTNSNGIADIPMWANYFPENGPGPYSGYMGSLPSDVVRGMGLPANNHVSFILYFQKTVKGGSAPSQTPTRTATLSPSFTPTPTRTPTGTAVKTDTPQPSYTFTATKPPTAKPPTATKPATTLPSTATFTPAPTRTPTPNGAACTIGVAKTLNVGAAPKGIAFDETTHRAFVGLANSSAVAVIDLNAFRVMTTWQTDGAGETNGVAFAAGSLFVTKRDTAQVSVLNGATGAFLGNIAVGGLPYGIAGRGDRVWVANFGDNSVTVIDANTRTVIDTVASSQYPSFAAALKGRTLVSAWGEGVDQYDSADQWAHTYPTGNGTFGLAVNPNNKKAFVGNRLSSELARLNTSALTIESVTAESEPPYALAFNPETNHLWVVLGASNRVRVRAGDTFAELKTVAVGAQGSEGGDTIGVWNNYVLVANAAAGTLTILRDCAFAEPTRPPAPPTPTQPAPPTPTTAAVGCTRRPRVLTPGKGAHFTQRKVALDWSDVGCATSYGVQLVRTTKTDPPMVNLSTGASSYLTPKLQRGSTYYLRVRACNDAGCGRWTKWRAFYIDPKQK